MAWKVPVENNEPIPAQEWPLMMSPLPQPQPQPQPDGDVGAARASVAPEFFECIQDMIRVQVEIQMEKFKKSFLKEIRGE